MQIKAILGTASLVIGTVGILFGQLGYSSVPVKLNKCTEQINTETIEDCREAAKEVAAATKDASQRALDAFFALLAGAGGFANLFANRKGKNDEVAKAELEKKLRAEAALKRSLP